LSRGPRATEVDAYVFVKDNLNALGWDTRNPERVDSGQVYTQNECLSNSEIRRQLGLLKPENIVRVTDSVLWVIEAKRSHDQLDQALREAEDYARKINRSETLQAKFITGVAGNELDTFLMRSSFLVGGTFIPIKMNGVEVSGLLSQEQCNLLVRSSEPNIEDPPIDEKLFLSRATHINEILHLGAVNPHQRASVMAALLLATLSETGPNLNERNLSVLIGDINSRVASALRSQGKPEFYDYIRISPPATHDNHVKFRRALTGTLQELNSLNIRSAMKAGADWLGAFYEVFLKYASWAQDLGIVLTPRHITRWVAEVMGPQANDIVYDPTCGTGGFLVAALDYVKRHGDSRQLDRFKQHGCFGVEQDPGVAALAVVNMIFRGDGKNNIIEGNCFAKSLSPAVRDGVPTAQYASAPISEPPATKVMMNPPFALKHSGEKEYRFVEQALKQLQHGGLLFTVLPYSAMVRRGEYLGWRRNLLLENNTLLAVITLPSRLFYPVRVESVGVFIKKGTPHPPGQEILWIRATQDGFVTSKGRRLPDSRAQNDLEATQDHLQAFIHNPNYPIPNVHQSMKAARINMDDTFLELVPEAYLDQAEPAHDAAVGELENRVRDKLAFLVKSDRAVFEPQLMDSPQRLVSPPAGWKRLKITELFDIGQGDFRSFHNLDPGAVPGISRTATDNGFEGFYEKPEGVKLYPAGVITVSTVSADAFLQPMPFIATYHVLICTLKKEYADIDLECLMFIELAMNQLKWRYSYGRQSYRTKYAEAEIVLPVDKDGEIDWQYMRHAVANTKHWPLVRAGFR
jgi:type I restriction enzyme M protein